MLLASFRKPTSLCCKSVLAVRIHWYFFKRSPQKIFDMLLGFHAERFPVSFVRPTMDSDRTVLGGKIPMLTNVEDFPKWRMSMEIHLGMQSNDLMASVDNGNHVPVNLNEHGLPFPNMDASTYTEKDLKLMARDRQAYSLIMSGLPYELQLSFTQHNNAKDLWLAILDRFEGDENIKENRRDFWLKQFNMFGYVQGETIQQHISRFNTLVSKLKSLGQVFVEHQLSKQLLDSLPMSWHNVCLALKDSPQFKEYTLAEVVKKIEYYDMEYKKRQMSNPSSAHK